MPKLHEAGQGHQRNFFAKQFGTTLYRFMILSRVLAAPRIPTRKHCDTVTLESPEPSHWVLSEKVATAP